MTSAHRKGPNQSMATQDAPGIVVAPPVHYVVFLLMAFFADHFYPVAMVNVPWSEPVGYGVVGLSFLWMWLVERQFRQCRTSSSCSHSAAALIVTGPFKYSRNPAYLGIALMFVGISLFVDSFWVFAAIVPASVSIHWFVIRKEEAYLARKFGDEYVQYRERVRRWI